MNSLTGLVSKLQQSENIIEPLQALTFVSDASAPNKLFLCTLAEHRFIRLSGPDAQKFLQGQCTCDFNALTPGQYTRGGHCNPKGRIITGFVAVKLSDNDFVLRVHQSIADSALAALKRYAVFSKLTLELDTNIHSFALIGESANAQAQALLEKGALLAHHKDSTHVAECWLSANQNPLESALDSNTELQATELDLWKALQIQCGFVEIRAEEQEQYLPQELNYRALNAVSFKKGCYTGQEVIARLHYKGKLKKGLYLGRVESAQIDANTAIVDRDGAKLGTLIQCARTASNSTEFLALVDHSSIDDQIAAQCQNSEEKIEWLPFAYAIPKGE